MAQTYRKLVLVLLGSCLMVAGGAGCGDDDGGGGKAGADGGGSGNGGGGGSGDSGAPDGGGGSSGSGAAGSGAPDAGHLTKAECLAMSVQTIPDACLDCTCEADPDATAQCGGDCWSLLTCVVVRCDGKLDDLACIAAQCSDFMSGAASAMAMVAGPVLTECATVCTSVADDGGTEDGGN